MYGLTIFWERETGILKRLLVAPASRPATFVGRSVASGVRAVVQAMIIFPVAILLGVKFILNPVYITAAILVFYNAAFAVASVSFKKIIE
ncbi:ABC transporter permease [Candidatus Methanocrinis natronophilus]|uniref:ABC transporter permease n=1 Tax=Candidatus Methanocrinis natronophilus TaxID=3033396 RepID=A0ABT5X9Q5_9EURY|nr:ABC transporter permease [Candidatus Methanocrinis natronophilus]MDF0591439.1 ABC transporter permease [Candidatus Methanocrinis natronophilus]